jgi:succinate--hydroxymethylglutarate CoA-transferase
MTQLDYDHLRTVNRRLIYTSLTGYGQTGPCAKMGGYDVIIAAVGGLMHITGPADGAPCKPGVALTDQLAGLYAHGAIMAALIQRASTGEGVRARLLPVGQTSWQVNTLT